MRFLLRFVALGLVGYIGYRLFQRYGDFLQQMAIGDEAAHDEFGDQGVMAGHPGQMAGVPSEIEDAGGEVRTFRVGRGVIHT